MFKKISIILTLVFSLSFIGCGNTQKKIDTESISNDINSQVLNENDIEINKEDVIEKLTSDEFEGRLTGSKGNKLTEEYLIDVFTAIGLEKVFNDDYRNTFVKEVSNTYGTPTIETRSEEKSISNIVGKIKGKDSTKAIIVSAHFDHIGKQQEQIIRGAIDNASGVAVLLDVANKLNTESKNNQPLNDIIFCAFNGEEIGLLGSENFLKDIKGTYKQMININIDCVGYKHGGDMVFLKKEERNNVLYESMENSLNRYDLKVTESEIKGVSDHVNFGREGIPNIGLIEANVSDVIHSTKDTIELIDFNRLDKIVDSICHFITNFK